MKLRWLSSALSELDRVHEYISQENPKAAKRVFMQIQEAGERLRQFPQSGRPVHVRGTREVVVTGLPFLIVYRITRDSVEMLRIFHTSQDRIDYFD